MAHLGSVQLVEGDLYCSPNSKYKLEYIPAVKDANGIDLNPFRPAGVYTSDVHFEELLHPRPWSEAFGWLAFIPLQPRYTAYPLECLSRIPSYLDKTEDNKFQLPMELIYEWKTLDQDIYDAVTTLRKEYDIPMILPFRPQARNYDKASSDAQLIKIVASNARKWFSVWFAALSYAIAFAEEAHGQGRGFNFVSRNYPRWQWVLTEKGFPHTWVDGISMSFVGRPLGHNSRVGCIIDLHKTTRYQPSIEWLMWQGVGVWYRWGQKECDLVKVDPKFSSLMPPILLAQEISTLVFPTPSTPPPASSSDHYPQETPDEIQPSWVKHFRSLNEKEQALLAVETPKQAGARENRARHPPTTSARVFEWVAGPTSNSLTQYVKEELTRRERADRLEDFGDNQRVYNPIFNFWECCLLWGPDTYSPWDDVDFEDGTMFELSHVVVPKNPQAAVAAAASALRIESERIPDSPLSPTPSVASDDNDEPLAVTRAAVPALKLVESDPSPDLFQPVMENQPESSIMLDLSEVMGLVYGFLPPLPDWSPGNGEIQKKSHDMLTRVLGLGMLPNSIEIYRASSLYPAHIAFFEAISGKKKPPSGMWDIVDDAVYPLKLSNRLKCLRRINILDRMGRDSGTVDDIDAYWVLDPPEPTVPWRLALVTPHDALLVCRLPGNLSERDIAYYLMLRGITFRLFHESSKIPRPTFARPPISKELFKRPFDHKFTKQDYDGYVYIRGLLLAQPHMKAVLRRGGLVWRLALDTLGISDALANPKATGAMVSINMSGKEWKEDSLTLQELDLICGAYDCSDGDNARRACKSWWPLVRFYEKDECGENYGRWCNRREEWYTLRLAQIDGSSSDTPQPLTYTEWKSRQHGVGPIRAFHKEVHKQSHAFLDRHCSL
ncbi:hypothetical protein FA15DRAFT_603330 [Coprinopsis marcescibilis]|uniref:Uncharacterized protein n=1 Tax=Coprinopsis marcescibilis TaxID=230819 RepID=A0A5C3KF36_COPMA|nr:hypothetical protein FA15DRAFT_603330 [Coprinopsis marcescibilis]